MTAYIFTIASLLLVAPQEKQTAPLPTALFEAKTVFLANDTGFPQVSDKVYAELVSWGRFKVVTDPKAADLVFRFTSVNVSREKNGVTLSISTTGGEAAGPIWTVRVTGALVLSNNAKDCITQLRKKLEPKK